MSRRAVQEAPCDARVADGAVRGTIVGALWAMYFWNNEFGHVGMCPAIIPIIAMGTWPWALGPARWRCRAAR